jgi:plasmid stabilization system protein ParE
MVVEKQVVWDKKALNQLKEAYDYLKEKSVVAANKVRTTILNEAKNLNKHYDVYELDRFKENNDGTFRAFEQYSYRVAYRITATEIRILRVRHTSREPQDY